VIARLPEHIGRYQTGNVLGVGGFGVVVSAEDNELGSSVAIKILGADWAADPDIRRRFVDEARLLRNVQSESLVTVHDIGELEDGRPFFVMDLADRGSLADRLTGRAGIGVDTKSLRAIVTALAEGLSALHASGFVHRDITPNNLLIQRTGPTSMDPRRDVATAIQSGLIGSDERVLLGDLGLAKDVVNSDSKLSVLGGTPRFRAPEQLDEDAEIGPRTDVYGATAVLWNVVTGESPPEPNKLDEALELLVDRWVPVMRRGLASDPLARFADIDEWRTAVIEAIGDEASTSTGDYPAKKRYKSDLCPYQGLAAFQPGDAGRFFGRDAVVVDLVSRLRTRRILVVGGASGSGKSSLVRAGLIPAIQSGALVDSDRWPVVLFTPTAKPMDELEYQLGKALDGLNAKPGDKTSVQSSSMQWRRIAEQITDIAGGVLICIDQFEELFTLDHSGQVRTEYLEALSSIVDPADSRVRLVIIIRADFYAASSKFSWLASAINDNQILVGPMSRAELKEAIMEPARRAGLRLEESLVDAVLEEGATAVGALPLVSHAMAETWQRRSGSRLTVDDYRATGGVAGAIGQSAEALYTDKLGLAEREATRRLLLRMISPGDGVQDTRRPVHICDLQSDIDPDVMQHVADALVEARLLTVDRDNIQLAHEAIIYSWPRLRNWIDESRDDLRFQQRIEHAAQEWLDENRDPDLLYHGTPLAAATEWAETRRQHLNVVEVEFLDAAALAEQTALAVETAAKQRIRRNRRLAFISLAGLTIAALISSAIAFTAFQRAQKNEEAATQRLAQSLSTQAAELVNEDPRLALALASEVIARTGIAPVEARATFVNATSALVAAPYSPASTSRVVGDALSVGVHPKAGVIVTGNRNGSIELWDAVGASLGSPIKAHDGAIEELTFSTDGNTLLSASLDGTIMSWDFTDPFSPPMPKLLSDMGTILWSVAISPDGRSVATAAEDGTIRIFDINSGASPEIVADIERDFLTVQFSPDGALLLAGNGRGEVQGWRMSDRKLVLGPFNAHRSDVWEIVFHPNGKHFATASSDGRVRLWDTQTGKRLAQPFSKHAVNVRGIQIDSNGLLSAGDEQGRILFWDIQTATLAAASTAHHDAQVIDAANQPLGNLMVSLALDHTLRVWQPSAGKLYRSLPRHEAGVFGLGMSADESLIATGDGAGTVQVFNVQTGDAIAGPFRLSSEKIWAVGLNADASLVAAGDQKGAIAVWEVSSGKQLASLNNAHSGSVTSVVFYPDRKRLLTGSSDETVKQWDPKTLKTVGTPMGSHTGGVTRMALSPDGAALAVADRAGVIRIWDIELAKIRSEWIADDNTVWSVAWSPDGKMLATAHADEVVTLWDVASATAIRDMTPHPGGAIDIAFLADGVTIVSSARNGTISLWDRELGLRIGEPLGLPGAAKWRILTSKKSGWFVTAGMDGAVDIWDLLDTSSICRLAAWDTEAQRRFLGAGEEPVACQQ
jgi:WD40 repeat protein/serine/threonine protein kinase